MIQTRSTSKATASIAIASQSQTEFPPIKYLSAMLRRISAKSSPPEEPLLDDAPEEYGLIVTLDENGVRMEFVEDQWLPDIHPNGHGPKALQDLRLLKGGGSGVMVFGGTLPRHGSLVMKHGSHKDTSELFALATISRELSERSSLAQAEAQDMKERIPDFRMIYIAPQHLVEKPKEFWLHFKQRVDSHRSSCASGKSVSTERKDHSSKSSSHSEESSSHCGGLEEKSIRLFKTLKLTSRVWISRTSHAVKVHLSSDTEPRLVDKSKYALRYGAADGYNCLKAFVDELVTLQRKRCFKFMLAQKTIGGSSPRTAASHLAAGNLHGPLLDKLIDEFVHVIRNLQKLTREEERIGIDSVRQELRKAEKDRCALPFDISSETDAFVGFAIKKNWHPETGRFFCLRRLGHEFRKGKLYLTDDEKLPAHLLGILLKEKTLMNAVFTSAPARSTALQAQGYKMDSWRSLLKDAVSLESPAAQERLWNCGLADGGLHNLFLSLDQMLYLFDMGAPNLMPLPAFLTKFLFSFFHTLGMVDDKEKGRGWENRFEPVTEGKTTKLALTQKTKELLPKAYNAFKITMDRLVEVFFENDNGRSVRKLLLNYVTLQLLSDAAFCLDRWRVKGGGRSRHSNHNQQIEEWLWRSIWDIYVASDLNSETKAVYWGLKKPPTWIKT